MLAVTALTALLPLADETPEADDVVAGWIGFSVWLALILAVALLLVSFARQMRKVRSANEAGVYDEDPRVSRSAEPEAGDDGAN